MPIDVLDTFWSDASALPALPDAPDSKGGGNLGGDDLSAGERVAYRLIHAAAERGQPCPVNIDLEVAAGFNSSSMGAKLVRKLEARGLIRVRRFQRFRLVEIVATGKTTARPASMHGDRPLVHRGARSHGARGLPSDRKPYRSRP